MPKRGLLIKGGKYLELLEKADTLLIDKTGTITFGRPQITDVITVDDLFHAESQTLSSHKNPSHDEVLKLAASAEHYSEHPLAEAVRQAAISGGIPLSPPERFENIPGMGLRVAVLLGFAAGFVPALGAYRARITDMLRTV